MAFQTTNPSTQQVLQTFDSASPEQIVAAIDRSHREFDRWRQTTIAHRADVLFRAADRLEQHAGQYAQLITTEMGKPIQQSSAEIEFCVAILR